MPALSCKPSYASLFGVVVKGASGIASGLANAYCMSSFLAALDLFRYPVVLGVFIVSLLIYLACCAGVRFPAPRSRRVDTGQKSLDETHLGRSHSKSGPLPVLKESDL